MKPGTWTLDALKMPEDQKAYVQVILDGYSKPDGDCLEWNGTLSSRSAAVSLMVHKKRRYYQVRRLMWEMHVGPVPKGKVISARCGHKMCVKLDHLIPMDKGKICADNLKRTQAQRARSLAVVAQKKAKLTWDIVQAIRSSDASGPELAKLHHISKGHVNAIRRMDCWVTPEARQLRAA